MDGEKYNRWVRKIFETQDEEISCSDCFELASICVELEISGVEKDAIVQRVNTHLNQCDACHEEYEILRELVMDEKTGKSQLPKG